METLGCCLGRMDSNTSPNDRNKRACDLLLAAVERVLQPADALKEVDCSLFIVVDELGNAPKFLMAMCGAANQMIAMVGERFQKKCELMAGGTGVNGFAMRVGSLPDSYQLLPLPNATKLVWEGIVEEIKEPGLSVVRVLETNSTARQLATNPRMAAIMFEHLTRKKMELGILGLEPLPRAIKNILPIFLARVASEFRGLGGMCNVDAPTIGAFIAWL